MKELKVDLGERSYPIYIGENLLASSKLADITGKYSQVMVVTNTSIAPLYLDRVLETLSASRVHVLTIKDGESEKNLDVLNGRGISLDPDRIIHKLIDSQRGGYCFELNGLFAMVLSPEYCASYS